MDSGVIRSMSSRAGVAARVLGAHPDGDVVDQMCAFVGVAAPQGPIARDLVTGLFARLERVRIGTVPAVADLVDLSWSPPMTVDYDPPIPEPLVEAVFDTGVDLAGLDAAGLGAAAQQFSLTRADVDLAWQAMTEEETRFGWEELTRGPRGICDVVQALTTTAAHEWAEPDVLVLRTALQLHLTALGEGLLRLSEWHATPLRWRQHRDAELASTPVEMVPETLTARVSALALEHDVAPVTLFTGRELPRAPTYQWLTGWTSPATGFRTVGTGYERTPAAARFAAQVSIADEVAATPF